MPLRKETLSAIVDAGAARVPDQLVCVHPRSADIAQGWRSITLRDLSEAGDHAARWIERTLGRAAAPEAIAYLGANDARYMAFLIGCQKTGYSVSALGCGVWRTGLMM